MFDREGRIELRWAAGSGMLFRAEGHPVDMVMALMLGLRRIVEKKVPAENQRKAMRSLADQLLELTDVTTTDIDLAALLEGRAEG